MFPLLLALTAAPAADPAPAKSDCPTWSHYFQKTDGCAGKGLYPFEKQPRVCLVDVCPCGPADDTDPKTCKIWVKEFSSAAHIECPRFDVDGHPVPGNGLVIYEGMQLVVDPNSGKYDLTFTATVPDMPVNLRLQLVFRKDRQAYTLTLPPMRLEPKRDAKPGDPTAWTFHVAHRGYSTLFVQPTPKSVSLIPELPLPQGPRPQPGSQAEKDYEKTKVVIDSSWNLQRVGTGRFGTPVALEDPNR